MKKILKYPPLVTLLFILLMCLVSWFASSFDMESKWLNYFAAFILMGSLTILGISGFAFKKAKTTVNPTTPEKTSSLVKSGMYAYSRNPMYLGLFGILITLVLWLGNPFNLLLLPLYIMAINKLFIQPEERALAVIFTEQFVEYQRQVRRWI